MNKLKSLLGLIGAFLLSAQVPIVAQEEHQELVFGVNLLYAQSYDASLESFSDYSTFANLGNVYLLTLQSTTTVCFSDNHERNYELNVFDMTSQEDCWVIDPGSDGFEESFELQANHTYHFITRSRDDQEHYSALILYRDHTGEDHDIQEVSAPMASCTQSGYTQNFYRCTLCGAKFEDAEGTTSLNEEGLWAEASGHEFDSTGKCQHCSLTLGRFSLGDQTINIYAPSDLAEYDNYFIWPSSSTGNLHIFEPEVSGNYSFSDVATHCGWDIYAVVFDIYQRQILSGLGPGMNYEAGQTYIIKLVSPYDDCYSIPLSIHGPHTGNHNLTHQGGTPATCLDEGYADYYLCSLCGKMFTDQNCTEELTEIYLPPLGHQIGSDGSCVRGCDVHAKPLPLGEATIDVAAIEGDFGNGFTDFGENFYYFTAPSDGSLNITSDTDCLYYIYTANQEFIGWYYAACGHDPNTVQAGQTYFVGFVNTNPQTGIDDFSMTVHMPHTGDHTLTHVEAKEATCTERGNTEYWCCSLCGKYFSTTAANDEVEFWPFTDAPGHDLSDEGQCANCDFAATMLQLGSNTVTARAMAETGTQNMEVYKNNLYAFHSIRSGHIYLKAKTGTYLAIYDNCLNYIDCYDSSAQYYIFEGKTLYFAFIAYNKANIGDIPCEISYTWHDGDHILESQSALDATCTTDGFEVCQKCTLCGQTFDAEGNLWTEARIPALGHHMVAGECEHGCGLKATQLQIINGKIDVPAFAGNIGDWDEVAANNLYYVNAPISCYSIDLSGINRSIFNNKQQLTWGHTAEAGETIFFGLGSEQEVKNAKYEIYYYHNDNCQPAKHIESQDPTCTEPGYYEHYRCYCGARYSDEQCTEDCYETVIPALDHLMKDGECEHECGLKATELQLGENTVTIKQLTTDCNELADYGENLFYFNSPIDGWPVFSASTTTSVLAKTFRNEGSLSNYYVDYTEEFSISGDYGTKTSFLGLQSQSDIATLTLMVRIDHNVEEVPHNLEYHEKVDATCTAKGHEAYYQCTYCFSKFRDAEATDLIWEDNNISIPATGHNYNPEGKCESCDQVAPTLVQGVNTIEIDPQSINWTYSENQWEHYGVNIYLFHADHTGPIRCDDFEGGVMIRCFDTDHSYTNNYVEQGNDYYIGVKGNNAAGGDELTFTIYTEHNEEGGAHDPISQDAVDPTCTNSGYVAHLRCSICGNRYYLDENNNETSAYVEPLGHDMHDGQCSRCDLACPEIKIGHQTIDIAATENGELWNWDGNEGNRYYFIAPVSGQLTIQNEGSNEMCFSLWNSAQIRWYNNEYGYLTDNFPLDEGKTYFFCFRNRNGQAETGHPIFIFQQQNGDLNGDGKFTAEDVALLVKKVLEMSPAADPDSDPDGK